MPHVAALASGAADPANPPSGMDRSPNRYLTANGRDFFVAYIQ